MEYYSTRNKDNKKNFKEVVMQGLAKDGGLYIPINWPKLNIAALKNLNYSDLAFEVIYPFSGNIIPEEKLIGSKLVYEFHEKIAINDIKQNFYISPPLKNISFKTQKNVLSITINS